MALTLSKLDATKQYVLLYSEIQVIAFETRTWEQDLE